MAYSRRKSLEEKRNRRKAFVFFFLTIFTIVVLFFYGLPIVIKYAAFFADLGKSSQPVELSDNTPPPPPYIESLPSHTNQEKIEIKGSTEPGATVKVFINKKSEELISNSDGKFVTAFTLRGGLNTISVLSIDSSGNESKKTESEIILDKEKPNIEISTPADNSSFSGPKQRQLVIEGSIDNDAKLSINGRWVVVESNGTFSYATSLEEGDNNFTFSAEDEAGNISEKTLSVTYTP